MHEVNNQYELDNHWREVPVNINVDMMIVADNGAAPKEEPVADTSLLPAPDERVGDSAEPTAGGIIKKPPVDPPETFKGTPEEGPEHSEGDETRAQGALGELASAREVAESPEPAAAGELPAHLERIFRSTHDLVVNRSHPNQGLVDDALETYETGWPWTEVPIHQSHLVSRKYFVDDPDHRGFMAKFTDYAQEEPDRTIAEATTELAQAPDVRAIVDSDAAQQIAREQGFAGISFVEPVLAVEGHGTEERTVIYPWQDGTVHSGEEGLHGALGGSVPGSGIEAVNTVVDRMNGLFGIHGMKSGDLSGEQIIVGSEGMLHLIDTEIYEKFTLPEPILSPREQQVMAGQEWSPITAASSEVIVGYGQLAVVRGGDEVNPQLVTNTGEGGAVITMWNSFTGEASMVNIQDRDLAADQLQELHNNIPTLGQPGVIAHLVGRGAIDPEDGHRYMDDADLVFEMKAASQRSGVYVDGPTTVRLDTKTGKLETFDDRGEKTYSYTPPSTVDDVS